MTAKATRAPALRVATITEPIFYGSVIVGLGTYESAVRWLRKHSAEGVEWGDVAVEDPGQAFTAAIGAEDGSQGVFIWFDTETVEEGSEGGSVDVSVVTHEAHHAANHILRSRGVSRKECMGETGAYYQGWLASEMVGVLKKLASKGQRGQG